ncbi:MAG: hypothetical protein JWM68_2107 [Verrucomicrobiales bacterium]|nr:hypothetical protein [Verrucomicrobiales bacterium]
MGPYTIDEVRMHLRSGMIKSTDLAWYLGIPDWIPLSSIPEIGDVQPLAQSQYQPPSSLTLQKPPTPSYVESAPPLLTSVAPAKKNKALIVITMLAAGIIGLVCLMLTIGALADGGPHRHPSIPLLILGFFGTAAGFVFAAQMIGLLNQRVNSAVCECCNQRGPTMKVTLNRHIGAVLLMFHRSRSGAFCKPCISKTFWEYTSITALLGWWGMFSCIITPVVLTNNVISYARSFFMSKK